MDFDSSHGWDKYLDKYPDKREEMQLAISLILNVKPSVDQKEIEKDSRDIWASIDHKLTHKKLRRGSSAFSRIFSSTWIQVAATVLLAIGFSSIVYFNSDLSQELALEQIKENKVTKFNPKGRKSTVTLSDRTIVELNAQSKIEYLDNFNPHKREVTLTGEAFFDVERDEKRPFIINVNGVTVKVLGTSFNVKGYPGDNKIQVAVSSGNVEVYDISSSNSVNLKENEMAEYSYSSGSFDKMGIADKELTFGWKDQKLVFRNQGFNSIMEELSMWYGVEIILEGVGNPNKKITGVYENASLKEVMISLSHNYNLKYELDRKTVRIYK